MMKTFLSLLFSVALSFSLQAQPFPDAFGVIGVAVDDVLNIRSKPTASSDIVGSLGPYAINIEVLGLSQNGKWGKISTGEGNGWVAMRFLERSNHTPPGEVPRPMACFGTEPFWALGMYPTGDEYELAGEGRQGLTLVKEVTDYMGYGVVFEERPGVARTLMIERAACSDGMSDRDYGWRAILFNETPQGDNLQYGCCTLDFR